MVSRYLFCSDRCKTDQILFRAVSFGVSYSPHCTRHVAVKGNQDICSRHQLSMHMYLLGLEIIHVVIGVYIYIFTVVCIHEIVSD